MKQVRPHNDRSLNNYISHESLRALLELLENTPLTISSTDQELPITQLLDALDSEFLLGKLLGQKIEITLNEQCHNYIVSFDCPEHSLASACLDTLMNSAETQLSREVVSLLDDQRPISTGSTMAQTA